MADCRAATVSSAPRQVETSQLCMTGGRLSQGGGVVRGVRAGCPSYLPWGCQGGWAEGWYWASRAESKEKSSSRLHKEFIVCIFMARNNHHNNH